MTADLELRHIPSSVLVGRALDPAELCLIRCVVVVDIERKLDYNLWFSACTRDSGSARLTFEELVSLVPVNNRIEEEVRARISLHSSCALSLNIWNDSVRCRTYLRWHPERSGK